MHAKVMPPLRRAFDFAHGPAEDIITELSRTRCEEIIRSPETKLLIVKFERSVSAEDARKAWRDGLENNCQGSLPS